MNRKEKKKVDNIINRPEIKEKVIKVLKEKGQKFLLDKNLNVKINEVSLYKDSQYPSSLHVLVNYKGDVKDSELFNIFSRFQPLNNVKIDWNPINNSEYQLNSEYLEQISKDKKEYKNMDSDNNDEVFMAQDAALDFPESENDNFNYQTLSDSLGVISPEYKGGIDEEIEKRVKNPPLKAKMEKKSIENEDTNDEVLQIEDIQLENSRLVEEKAEPTIFLEEWRREEEEKESQKIQKLKEENEKLSCEQIINKSILRKLFNTDKILEAIEKDEFPIMKKQDEVYYVINPIDMKIYKGANQLGLQTNNALNHIDVKSYMPLSDFYNKGGVLDRKLKTCSQIVTKGIDDNGNYIFDIVVPCRVTDKEKRAQKKEIKEERRRSIFDARYKYTFGRLPNYFTNNAKKIEFQEGFELSHNIYNKQRDLTKKSSVEERLDLDLSKYFQCMFTKKPYVPETDWTSEQWKEKLRNYVNDKPERVFEMANKYYSDVQEVVKNPIRTFVKPKIKEEVANSQEQMYACR